MFWRNARKSLSALRLDEAGAEFARLQVEGVIGK